MNAMPPSPEWSTDNLPEERRRYLEGSWGFEEIAALIKASARRVAPAEIRAFRSAPRRSPEARARQIVIRVALDDPRACDLFYNARDGLRGQYWQAPEAGDRATRYLIDQLMPLLMESVSNEPPVEVDKKIEPMPGHQIEQSLREPSAKIWPSERDAQGQVDISFEGKPQLFVRRWWLDESSGRKVPNWRWTPHDRDLEIKGALIDPEGRCFVPEGKKNRSSQIHLSGFTWPE
jgi:hypothetical protein